eukprot:3212670-Karenia_brevis.AAC.1
MTPSFDDFKHEHDYSVEQSDREGPTDRKEKKEEPSPSRCESSPSPDAEMVAAEFANHDSELNKKISPRLVKLLREILRNTGSKVMDRP